MAYFDRIVFANTHTALMLAMMDAGVLSVIEDRVTKLPGVAMWSYIGEAYGDGNVYALVSFNDTVDMVVMDARLAANLDPTRTPLRIRSGALISDPDADTRQKFLQELRENRERLFQRIKDRMDVIRVSRLQLRHAAYAASPAQLTALDAAVAATTDVVFKLKWEEHDDFSRAQLNALTTLTVAQRDNLFDAARMV